MDKSKMPRFLWPTVYRHNQWALPLVTWWIIHYCYDITPYRHKHTKWQIRKWILNLLHSKCSLCGGRKWYLNISNKKSCIRINQDIRTWSPFTKDQSKKLQQFTKLCKGDMSHNSKTAKMVLGRYYRVLNSRLALTRLAILNTWNKNTKTEVTSRNNVVHQSMLTPRKNRGVDANSVQLSFTRTELYRFELHWL